MLLPMDLQPIIALAKSRAGNPDMPDSQLAAMLGISQPAFARDKKRGFSDAVAMRLAAMAGEDATAVLVTVRAMRERNPEVRSVLERLAKRLATAAGAAFLATGLSGQLTPAGGGEGR